MRDFITGLGLLALVAGGFLACTDPVSTAPPTPAVTQISLANPGFEQETIAEGSYILTVAGWDLSDIADSAVTYHIPAAQFTGGAHGGRNVVSALAYQDKPSGRGISQLTGAAFETGRTYTLTAYFGRNQSPANSALLQIIDEDSGSPVASQSILISDSYEWYSASISFTAGYVQQGHGIRVLLYAVPVGSPGGTGSNVYFDDVTLTVQ